MRGVIVDAGGANTGSVRYAFGRLGVGAALATDAASIEAADRVVLPGVGTAAQVMGRLRELGLVQTLQQLRTPLLGICVGMQLLYARSEEGDIEGLGLLDGTVRKLSTASGLRVPHMGWNTLQSRGPSSLMDGIDAGMRAYFVHSYAADVTGDCVASCDYGTPFAALVQRDNVAGTQFHPERSAALGARLLGNFIERGVMS